MAVQYKLTSLEGEQFLTIFAPDGTVTCATPDTHGNFSTLVELALAQDDRVYEEAEVGKAIQRRFDDVVEGRVAIRNGVVYFDDDPMDNALTKAILSFLEDGEDFGPLIKFFDKVMSNPQPESREQFYRWIEFHDFPIDEDGDIVAYKSVYSNGDGTYRSCHAGHAFVNGVEVNGYVVQSVGDVVTMPRSEVQHDPDVACHVGLHAGTFEYASTFSGDTLMHVKINPRDVVSVPHDCTSQKVRLCRYEVEGFAENEYKGARFRRDEDEAAPLDDEDYLDEWESEFLDDPADEDYDDEEQDETVDERPFSGNSSKFRVGDRVQIKLGVYGNRSAFEFDGEKRLADLIGVYEVVAGSDAIAHNAFHALVDGVSIGLWDDEGVLVEDESADSKVDTRLNHLRQPRGAGGRFVKRS